MGSGMQSDAGYGMQDMGCNKLAGLVRSAGPRGLGTLGAGCLAWHYLDGSGLGGC